jgi:uncharacterized protein YndB with AHSA1/START domain
MNSRDQYAPGPAAGAEIRKNGDAWTLVLVRELRHPPDKVWRALTDPDQLRQWAPFDSDGSLASAGTVKLTTVGAPKPMVSESTVKRAEPPRLLEHTWGGFEMRWELEPLGAGTRLTLWHNIARDYIAMGAAGWHVCLDVLDRQLAGEPIGRIVGPDAMKLDGWQRLHLEYASQLGVEVPAWAKGK